MISNKLSISDKSPFVFYYNTIVDKDDEKNIKETLEKYLHIIYKNPNISITLEQKNEKSCRYKVMLKPE